MKIVTTVETETNHITEVFTSWSVIETNELLDKGWILLHGGVAHKDSGGFQVKPCWILGKIPQES